MSSLEALLAKLPSVVAPEAAGTAGEGVVIRPHQSTESSAQKTLELLAMEKVAKVEINDNIDDGDDDQIVYTQLLHRYHDHNCHLTTTSHNHGF